MIFKGHFSYVSLAVDNINIILSLLLLNRTIHAETMETLAKGLHRLSAIAELSM